jgi:hypothetical protein
MSEQTEMTTDFDTEGGIETVDELSLLKERARAMGIPVPRNVGVETLKKRIADKLEGKSEEEEAKGDRKMSQREMEQEIRERLRREKTMLIRCRIYNLNPSKRDLQGEIITVGNRFMGTIRKFIPFGEATDNGYHIPKVIYDDLKNRKYQQVMTKTVRGQIEVSTRMVPEYNIEVLAPLTKEELAELALKQEAAKRLGAE